MAEFVEKTLKAQKGAIPTMAKPKAEVRYFLFYLILLPVLFLFQFLFMSFSKVV